MPLQNQQCQVHSESLLFYFFHDARHFEKAKSLRPIAEKMITLAKRGDLHARRQALSYLQDKAVTHKLFDELKDQFLDRQGGYLRIVKKGVRKGDDLATPLRASKVFPPILIHMVALGEKSGQLEQMLVKVADSYEEEVDMTVNTLVSLLEPLMVMVMGVFVGFMVLAILLPIFDLSQAVG